MGGLYTNIHRAPAHFDDHNEGVDVSVQFRIGMCSQGKSGAFNGFVDIRIIEGIAVQNLFFFPRP